MKTSKAKGEGWERGSSTARILTEMQYLKPDKVKRHGAEPVAHSQAPRRFCFCIAFSYRGILPNTNILNYAELLVISVFVFISVQDTIRLLQAT